MRDLSCSIIPALISKESWAEKYADFPSRDFMDMKIIYALCVPQKNHTLTAKIDAHLAQLLGIDEKELYDMAMDNLTAMKPSADLIATLIDCPVLPDSPPLYVVRTGEHLGANVLLRNDFLRKLADDIGPYYLIPSSIHEVIAVPEDIAGAAILRDMIQVVNETEVLPEERLSYQLYRYNAKDGLSVCPAMPQEVTAV